MSEEKIKCKARAKRGDIWGRDHRCSRNATKDGFCSVHHPDAKAARDKKSEEKYQEKLKQSPWHRLEEMTKQRNELLEALEAAQQLIKEALPKFNWGASALDANAIKLLNEVPGKVDAAIAKARGE